MRLYLLIIPMICALSLRYEQNYKLDNKFVLEEENNELPQPPTDIFEEHKFDFVPGTDLTLTVSWYSGGLFAAGFLVGAAKENLANNVTRIPCITEAFIGIDSTYSAYYFMAEFIASNETDYLSLAYSISFMVKGVNTIRSLECFGLGEMMRSQLSAIALPASSPNISSSGT